MKVAVLDGQVLVLFIPPGTTDRAAYGILSQLKAAIPDWRFLVFPAPGSVLDLRGDPEAARLASELWDRVASIVEPAP